MSASLKAITLVFLITGGYLGEAQVTHSNHRHYVRAIKPNKKMSLMSPDRKYVASIEFESGTDAELTVRQCNHDGVPSRQSRSKVIDDIYGFLWLPKHPHTLVYATAGIFGTAMIGMFQGNRQNTVILTAKHPHNDAYILYAASLDGQRIIYGYAENYVPQYNIAQAKSAERKLNCHRVLNLR